MDSYNQLDTAKRWPGWVTALINSCVVLTCIYSLVAQFAGLLFPGDVYASWESLHCDFLIFFDSATQARMGLPLYEIVRLYPTVDGPPAPLPNMNHPVVVLLMLPLTWFDRETAYAIWTIFNVSAFALAIGLTCHDTGVIWKGRAALVIVCSSVAFPGLVRTFQLGQVSGFIALLVVGAWIALRRGYHGCAVWLIGVVVVLKPFLLPLIVFVLTMKSWRMLLLVAVGFVSPFLAALPMATTQDYRDWFAILTAFGPGLQQTTSFWNISLAAAASHLLGASPPEFVVGAMPAMATLAALVTVSLPGLRNQTDRQFGLVLILALLGSPLGWVHYLPILLPTLAAAYLDKRDRRMSWRWALSGIAILWLIPLRTTVALLLPFQIIPTLLLLSPTFGLMLTFAALLQAGAINSTRNPNELHLDQIGRP